MTVEETQKYSLLLKNILIKQLDMIANRGYYLGLRPEQYEKESLLNQQEFTAE
jgi:hypothetical protein